MVLGGVTRGATGVKRHTHGLQRKEETVYQPLSQWNQGFKKL